MLDDYQLSKNFTVAELCRSQTAARMGRKVEPTDCELFAMEYHCKHVLQPIRDLLGAPVMVTSGLRPEWLNKRIGGSAKSQHLTGNATDFVVRGDLRDAMIKIIQSDIQYDQIIYEFGEWIHVSSSTTPRLEILTAYSSGGLMPKTVYEVGLVDIK